MMKAQVLLLKGALAYTLWYTIAGYAHWDESHLGSFPGLRPVLTGSMFSLWYCATCGLAKLQRLKTPFLGLGDSGCSSIS